MRGNFNMNQEYIETVVIDGQLMEIILINYETGTFKTVYEVKNECR